MVAAFRRLSSKLNDSDWLYSRYSSPSSEPFRASSTVCWTRPRSMPVRVKKSSGSAMGVLRAARQKARQIAETPQENDVDGGSGKRGAQGPVGARGAVP